jgi:hypothetical protein
MFAPCANESKPLETQHMETSIDSYTVTATSHIGPVKYTIVTTIEADDVAKFLAKGVLYEGQRIGASKAVKALGGGKRGEIPFSDEAEAAVHTALLEVFGDSAEITTSEYVKAEKAPRKFVRANAILDGIDMAGGSYAQVAARVGYSGSTAGRPEAFLLAIEKFQP